MRKRPPQPPLPRQPFRAPDGQRPRPKQRDLVVASLIARPLGR